MEAFIWITILAALVALYFKFKKKPRPATNINTIKLKLSELPSSDFRQVAAYTGLFVAAVPDWLADAAEALIGGTEPVSKQLTAIQNTGEPLTADEKKDLGVSGRARLGQQFIDCLSDAGRMQPMAALGIAVNTARANRSRAGSLKTVLIDMGRYSTGAQLEIVAAEDDRTCEAAKRISGKRYQLSEAPALPLQKCDSIKACGSHCRCFYHVYFP